MAHLRYIAPIKKNEDSNTQLFSYGLLGFVFVSVIMVLVYLYPGRDLVDTLLNQNYISEADFFYSMMLADKDTNEKPLTSEEIHDNPREAILQLDKFSHTTDKESLWFHYIVLRNITYDKNLSLENKKLAIDVMTHYFDTFLATSSNEKQINQLVTEALAISKHQYALSFYEKLIALNPNRDVAFYARVGQVALWANQCEKSANYYFIAKDKSQLIDDKRYFYFQALKTLYSCEEYTLALSMAKQHLTGLSADVLTYQLLVDLSIKGDQPSMAQDFLLKSFQLENIVP